MEESQYIKQEPNMTSYLRGFTNKEKEALARVQEELMIEVSLQSIVGREHYAPMLEVQPGTRAFQIEARRALKKPAPVREEKEAA
jgi:DNA-directed RNA polymerase subunit F